MPAVALSGNDALTLNGYLFAGLADGTVVELNYPNELVMVNTGKNGNSTFALNEKGKQADLKIKTVRGSADDKFMLGLLSTMKQNFPGFILIQGTFTKKLGDGQGNVSQDQYVLSNGAIAKEPVVKSNVEGDTEQATTTWELKFSNAPRVFQG